MGRSARVNRNGYRVILPPAYTGVVFLFCWTYFMFYATSAGIEAAAPISLYSTSYTISATSMLATLLIVSFLHIDRTAFLTDVRTKTATGIALPAGTSLLLAASVFQAPLAVAVIGGVITGVFSGIMLLQWIVAYQRVGLRVAAASFPMLMAMAVGICATLMYLPRIVMTLATIAFPLVSEIMFHEVHKDPWPKFEDEAVDVRDRPINFTLMLLPFAVYAFASGFLDYSSVGNNYTFAFYAFGAFIPVIVSGVYMFIVERGSFVSAFLVPLGFLIAVCVPFLALSSLAPFAPFISIGELGIEVLIFIVPIGFAEFFSLDAQKTYALSRLVYVIFSAVGWSVAQFAHQTYGALLHSQVSLVIIFIGVEVLAVCLIVAIVKAQKSLPLDSDEMVGEALNSPVEETPIEKLEDSIGSTEYQEAPLLDSDHDDKPTVVSPEEKITNADVTIDADAVASMICEEYGLSQRERDVFGLLAKGYTSPRIQTELYIAAGTVNYHSRNIYAKLGVHSKQELIQLFEERARS